MTLHQIKLSIDKGDEAMKTLYALRHSDKDGKMKNRIGTGGVELANLLGSNFPVQDVTDLFHHELPRTTETALAWLSGYYYSNVTVHPVVPGMGNDEIFGAMATEGMRKLAPEMGNFRAVLKDSGEEKCREWAEGFMNAVRAMFDVMDHGGTGVSFSHSPTVEFCAYAVSEYGELDDAIANGLGSCQGIILKQDEDGTITLVGLAQ